MHAERFGQQAGDGLLTSDNAVVSPHSLCWTEDFTRDVSSSAIDSILAIAEGECPVAANAAPS